MVQQDDDQAAALAAPVMEFTTEPRAGTAADNRKPFPFILDGIQLTAYMPSDDQLAMLYRVASRTATAADKVNGSFEFLEFTLAPASWEHVRARIVDPGDAFGIDPGAAAIVDWIIDTYCDENGVDRDQIAAGNPQAVKRAQVAKAQQARKPAARRTRK